MSDTSQTAVEDLDLETLESEEQDAQATPPAYEVVTYPADFTLEGLVAKLAKKEILIPGFQRKFVWTQNRASKLIESFLLGLPVPALFLYVDPDTSKFLVIDGQQRLKTTSYFFEGYFGEEERGRRPVFRLTGLNERSPYANLTFKDLENKNPKAHTELLNTVLRAFVIKQLNPADSTSMYHIFERLNTGGAILTGQEVRNCVYYGALNDLVNELNLHKEWRGILGKPETDRRMRDVELVVRFLALHFARPIYEKPLKDFISSFMSKNRNPTSEKLAEMRELFRTTCERVHSGLGPRPFRIRRALNAAVFDAVFCGVAGNPAAPAEDIGRAYDSATGDPVFVKAVSSGTTDEKAVADRFNIFRNALAAS